MLSGAARLGGLEAVLGPSRGQVTAMLGHLERWWGYDGPFWAVLGPMLGSLEVCWAVLGQGWAVLRLCWAHLEARLQLCGAILNDGGAMMYVGPMLAHVEPSWELCWGHVWAIYVETILRCQFFRPGPPPGAQNHVKTEVLQHRQDEIPCRRRARNTVKNNVLEHRKHNTP